MCIANAYEDLQGLTAVERLYLLDYKRKLKGSCEIYLNPEIKVVFEPLIDLTDKFSDFEGAKNYFLNNKSKIHKVSYLNTIEDLVHYEISSIVKGDIKLKKCKFCEKYFVPSSRSDYCTRIPLYEDKTCKEIGAKRNYQKKQSRNPVFATFQIAYSRMNNKVRAKKITQSEFFHWSEFAILKRKQCEKGYITLEEFKIWLDEDKKTKE